MKRFVGVVVLVTGAFALSGCGDSLPRANFQSAKNAADAIAKYDANKDGKLDGAELKKCPSLLHSLAEIDTNNDKAIDVDELTQRIETYHSTALRGFVVRVARGQNPVPGVTVTFEPESFLTGTIKPASGVSDSNGYAEMKIEGELYPGAQPGLYRTIVSKKDSAGKETLPARFNTDSTLGWEVGPSNRLNVVIDLDR
jgi:hypothetical protein